MHTSFFFVRVIMWRLIALHRNVKHCVAEIGNKNPRVICCLHTLITDEITQHIPSVRDNDLSHATCQRHYALRIRGTEVLLRQLSGFLLGVNF